MAKANRSTSLYTVSMTHRPSVFDRVIYCGLPFVQEPIAVADIVERFNDSISEVKHNDKGVNLTLGQEYTFECRISPAYPKPTVKFFFNDKEIGNNGSDEKPPFDVYDGNLHVATSSFTFTAEYGQNNNQLRCSADQNIPSNGPVSKTANLQIQGKFARLDCAPLDPNGN
jgi:hypothetical protein